ncbi:MAG: hypothetical protein LBV51_01105 [Acholeplasmatales bacterium]|jgi:tetratricopeptide (TPR) repeat protein|nr:hypothetical protein [Acholeplasmatales bacterium]
MEIIAIICPQCGGRVESVGGVTKCSYCGTTIMVKQEQAAHISSIVRNSNVSNNADLINYNKAGWDFIELGFYDKSKEKFDKAVNEDPRDINSWTGLIISQIKMKTFTDLFRYINAAFKMADYNQKNAIIDAIVYENNFPPRDFKKVIINLLTLLPNNGKLWLNLYLTTILSISKEVSYDVQIGAVALSVYHQVTEKLQSIIDSNDTSIEEKQLAKDNLEYVNTDYEKNYKTRAEVAKNKIESKTSNKGLVIISILLGIIGLIFIAVIIYNIITSIR